jgi:thiamine-monophosphate kinase
MELAFIDWLRARLPSQQASLIVGPGDDAAILDLGRRHDCVVTTDMLTDDVDFRLSEVDPRRIGRKALAVNLSDLAAMGSEPVAAVISLVLPRDSGFALAQQLYEGILPLAAEFNTSIAGGDTNTWNGALVISITAIGRLTDHGPFLRSGAKPGDEIVVTGDFGGSILGRHFDFTPRVREALLLRERYDVHAAIDVSDGLSLDLSRLCRESGCGAELQFDRIPIAAAARELAAANPAAGSGLDHALGDGEDFELLMTLPADEARRLLAEQPLDVPLTSIGRIVAEPGLWSVDASGTRRPLVARGYEH